MFKQALVAAAICVAIVRFAIGDARTAVQEANATRECSVDHVNAEPPEVSP